MPDVLPSGTTGWCEAIGQIFALAKTAKDLTVRPALEKLIQILVQIFNDAMEKLGATQMDGQCGEWIKASVISDQELVVFR